MATLVELNSEPAVEELSKQILSEAKLWEAIQEARAELRRREEQVKVRRCMHYNHKTKIRYESVYFHLQHLNQRDRLMPLTMTGLRRKRSPEKVQENPSPNGEVSAPMNIFNFQVQPK